MAIFKRIAGAGLPYLISDLTQWEEWDGSSWVAASALPSVGDVVYANGFNSVIDQSWTVGEIRSTTFQGTAASGRFEIRGGGITFSGDRVVGVAGVVGILYINYGSGESTVLGRGYNTGINQIVTVVELQAGAILNLEYTGVCGQGGTGTSVLGNGNSAVINVINVEANTSTSSAGYYLGGSNYVVNFNGTATYAGNNSIPIIIAGSGNKLVNNGIIEGPPDAGHTSGVGAYITGTLCEFENNGVLNATAFGPAVIQVSGNYAGTPPLHSSSSTSWTTLGDGSTLVGTDQHPAIMGRIRVDDGADVQWLTKSPTTQTEGLYSAGQLGYPAEAKVENGEVYGPASEFTGTLDPVTISAGQIADLANALGLHITPQVLAAVTQP